MNIVVIGSCADSSILAKSLNERLTNSIIARIDMLKHVKNLLHMDGGLLTTDNNGTYIGDIEKLQFDNIPDEKLKQLSTILKDIDDKAKTLDSTTHLISTTGTFDALTNDIPSSSVSFVKIYSGAIDEHRINKLIRASKILPRSIVVEIESPKKPLLPIMLSNELREVVRKEAFMYVKCKTAADVLNTSEFKLLFKELNVELTQKAAAVVEDEKTPVQEARVVHLDFAEPFAGHAGIHAELRMGEMVADAA